MSWNEHPYQVLVVSDDMNIRGYVRMVLKKKVPSWDCGLWFFYLEEMEMFLKILFQLRH